jgi:peptidoglycan/LPS O-acetylase OafA/YrhL
VESDSGNADHDTTRRDVSLVLAACAISAGAHAALVPSHMENDPQLGLAFVVAVGVLLTVGVAVVLSPTARAAQAATLVFAALIASYAAATTVGLPVVSVEPEPVDGVALVTKLVETVGLVFALKLNQTVGGRWSPTRQEVSP